MKTFQVDTGIWKLELTSLQLLKVSKIH